MRFRPATPGRSFTVDAARGRSGTGMLERRNQVPVDEWLWAHGNPKTVADGDLFWRERAARADHNSEQVIPSAARRHQDFRCGAVFQPYSVA